MNWIGFFSLLLGVLSLLIAYYRFMRNHPELEIIDVSDTSTSAFKDYINDLEFSYKNKVYQELTSVELLIMNKSFRAIEREDIRESDPLILYSEPGTQFHDVRVIKKVGNSITDIKIIDDQTISLDISSMDMKSSLRIEVLGSGKDFKINGKGKLINANYSISRIKRLKKRLTFKELINNGADIFRGVSFLTIFLIPLIFLIDLGFEYSYTRSVAKIIAPKDFQEAKNQFLILDSLQENPSTSAIELISFGKDSIIDTIQISTNPTVWSMNWIGEMDSVASQIRDSLIDIGYSVSFGVGNEDIEKLINSGEYTLLSDLDSKYPILKKKLTGRKALNIFGESIQIGLYIMFFFFLVILFIGAKSLRNSLKYRFFLTESEREEIRKDYGRYDPARLYLWLIYLRSEK